MPEKIREKSHGASAEVLHTMKGQHFECENPACLPPGAWVNLEDGRLYRSEAGKSITDIRARTPFTFVKVGDNPNIPISQARTIAADYDVEPGF